MRQILVLSNCHPFNCTQQVEKIKLIFNQWNRHLTTKQPLQHTARKYL